MELNLAPQNVTNQQTGDCFQHKMSVSSQDQQNAEYQNDESIEIKHLGRQNSLVVGDVVNHPRPEEADHNSLNTTTSKSKSRWRNPQRRRFSRSLSNLISRRRSSNTLSTVISNNGSGATQHMDIAPAPSPPHPIPMVSFP
jgi:hypothetical protein